MIASTVTCPSMAAPARQGLLSVLANGDIPEEFVCITLATVSARGDKEVVEAFCDLACPRDIPIVEKRIRQLALRLLGNVASRGCRLVKEVGDQCIEEANQTE